MQHHGRRLHSCFRARRHAVTAAARQWVLGLAGVLCLAAPARSATFNYLATPVEIGPSSASTWEDVDVSAWVPAGATGVIIQFVATGTDRRYGIRKNGSSDTWMAASDTAFTDTTGFLMTGVDAGRVLEIYEEDTAIKTYLVGYTLQGVTFFTNAIDKSLSTTGSYQDIDISADTGADTAIGAIVTIQNTGGSVDYALRKKGSSDDHYLELKDNRATTCLIGVDGSERCEHKIESTNIEAHLVGYVTTGAVFFTNGVNKSTGTTGSYVDVDITADLGSDDANGAILQMISTPSASLMCGIRKNGASYDYYGDTKNEWAYVAIDAADRFEQKIEDTDKDVYLVGYTLAVSPPTISSGSSQSFFVGDSPTAMSTITVTEIEGGMITAANDIRIRIPAGFNMTWDGTDTTATIGGTASSKVSATVSYEDGDATLVLNVTSDFAAADVITVSDLGFTGFSAVSSPDYLELEVNNDDVVTATDDKTIAIGAPNYRSIGTASGDLYSVGTASATAGTSTVTFAGGADLPANLGQGDKLTIGGGGPATLFSDDFGDGTLDGWTDRGTDPLVETGGVLRNQSGGNADAHYTVDAGAAWTDYTYSVDIMADDDDISGFTFRVQGDNNYYRVSQGFGDNDGWWLRLRKVVGGSPSDLVAAIDNQGGAAGQVDSETTWYSFKVELAGTSIKVYVDNVLKFDITDSTFSTGTVGVWMQDQTEYSRFDNALVEGGGPDTVYHVLSRDSATQVTIQEIVGSTITNQSYSFERCYGTLQAWEDDREGDLVAEGRREVGVCYNDGVFTDRLVISGSTTDASHFMHLTVAAGQRHNGIQDGGAAIDAQGGWGNLNAIDVEDEYTQIEWLEIKDVHDVGDGIFFSTTPAADNGLVSGVYVHSFWQSGNAGVRTAAPNTTIRNSIFTGGTSSGIVVATGCTLATIENCTLYGSPASGDGVVDQAGTTVSIKNTISVNHPTGDDFKLWSTIAYFGNNMFSSVTGFDPDAQDGGNQLPPANLEHLFESLSSPLDLHLESSGHYAGNTGLDLSSAFTNDVDGGARSQAWDMGADETIPGTDPLSPKVVGWQEIEP